MKSKFWSQNPTFQLFSKDERITYLETKVAQQQQNLHLFKTMLQHKEVYVSEDEVKANSSFRFLTKLWCSHCEIMNKGTPLTETFQLDSQVKSRKLLITSERNTPLR